MYPPILRKGTRIRIGRRTGMRTVFIEAAIGIEFILPVDVPLSQYNRISGRKGIYEVVSGLKVLANPGGYKALEINYAINLQFDQIVCQSNRELAKSVLILPED